jgi:alpha-L-arabinofuranosidase
MLHLRSLPPFALALSFAVACSSGGSDGVNDSGVPGPACTAQFVPNDAGPSATITIDPAKVVNTFVPKQMFGVNAASWVSPRELQDVQPKVAAAGNYFLRFPGGSRADDYHWNSTGAYDAKHRWTPSDTQYTAGFTGSEMYRGTTSAGYSAPSLVTDGKPDTFWLSNEDTALPDAQWVYLDLVTPKAVDSVEIVWGTPYATAFEVQTWKATVAWPYPYMASTNGTWETTSAGAQVGQTGTQTVSFTAVTTQYIRVLLKASSAGANGVYAVSELTAFNGTSKVSNNVASISQTAATVSSTDPASLPGSPDATDFEAFMAYCQSFSPVADAMMTVNFGSGTPQEAAAWVHYANVVKGYKIRYWQIGNEMEGNWETGGPVNAADYVKRYLAFYDAMKKEDPSIVVLGPVSGGIGEFSNLGDGKTFIQDFIELLGAQGQASKIDAIDFHWYPNWETVTDEVGLNTVSQLGALASNIKTWLATAGAKPDVGVFMTEYNMAIGAANAPVCNNQLVNGLFTVTTLGEFIRAFGNGGGTHLWSMLTGGTTNDWTTATAGELGYLQSTSNPYKYQEHASYWGMQLMSSNWAIAGDTRPHQLVSATSSQASLATYANLRPDGALTLAVVNRANTAASASINLGSFAVGTAADVWTFDASNYVWETKTKPYHAEPDQAPTHTLTCGATTITPFTFAPFSITVIRFVAPGAATAVIPDAGSVKGSDAGADGGSAAKAHVLIDDMETTTSGPISLDMGSTGAAPGSWFGLVSPGSTANTVSPSPFAFSALEAPHQTLGSVNSAHATHIACSINDQYGYCQTGFGFTGSNGPFDISKYAGMTFWARSSISNSIKFQISNDDSVPEGGKCGKTTAATDSCWNSFATYIPLTEEWQKFDIKFADLRQDSGWGRQVSAFDATTARSVAFLVTGPAGAAGPAVAADFWIDDVYFFQ